MSLIAIALFLLGAFLPFVPHEHETWNKTLADLGSVIAGAWALEAGLLAVCAALIVAVNDQARRKREAIVICLAEIEAVWKYINDAKIGERLKKSIDTLQHRSTSSLLPLTGALETYRGHIGNNWLSLQNSSPSTFSYLPISLITEMTFYYSSLQNMIGLLNWMNNKDFTNSQFTEVVERQQYIRGEIIKLEIEGKNIIEKFRKEYLGVNKPAYIIRDYQKLH